MALLRREAAELDALAQVHSLEAQLQAQAKERAHLIRLAALLQLRLRAYGEKKLTTITAMGGVDKRAG